MIATEIRCAYTSTVAAGITLTIEPINLFEEENGTIMVKKPEENMQLNVELDVGSIQNQRDEDAQTGQINPIIPSNDIRAMLPITLIISLVFI